MQRLCQGKPLLQAPPHARSGLAPCSPCGRRPPLQRPTSLLGATVRSGPEWSEPSPVGCRCGAAAALSRLAKVTEPTAFDHPGTDAMTSRARALRRVSSTTCCPSRMVAMPAAEVAHLDARPPRACMFTRCYYFTTKVGMVYGNVVFASLVLGLGRPQSCTSPKMSMNRTTRGYSSN